MEDRQIIWDYTSYQNVLSLAMMDLIFEKVSAWYCVSKPRWDGAVLVCERLSGDCSSRGQESLRAYCEGAANMLWLIQKEYNAKKWEDEKKRDEARIRRKKANEARLELQKAWPN